MGRQGRRNTFIPAGSPFFVDVAESAAGIPEGFELYSSKALAIVNDGKARAGLYRHAEDALHTVTGGEEVEYIDDPSWETFPGLGEVVKTALNGEELCICVARSPSQAHWAVGVGNK